MYESHIVCQFFREWGFRDGLTAAKNGQEDIEKISLLGNMQNKFDAVFGDAVASNLKRFQLIEFKQDLAGFRDEATKGKKNRAKLYEHLQKDKLCRKLSYGGHAGAYVKNNVLRIDPYHALCAQIPKEEWPQNIQDAFFHDFDSYFESWNSRHTDQKWSVGLDAQKFMQYVTCMYQHLGTNSKGILLIYSDTKKMLVPFYGSIKGLIDELKDAFPELAKVKTSVQQPDNSAEMIKDADAAHEYLDSLQTQSHKPFGKGKRG